MSCVRFVISPPERVLKLLEMPPKKPSDCTLLPTTMFPGTSPFCARQ
jgi:hypothetical protein